MTDAAPPRRIWLCADDYGLSPGVNRAIRDLIERGRLNATSVMVVGPSIGRDEVDALRTAAANSARCGIGLHVTLTRDQLRVEDAIASTTVTASAVARASASM